MTRLLAFAALAAASAQAQAPSPRYAEDFDVLWETVARDYAYLDQKQTDWPRVRDEYRPLAASAENDQAFLNVLERTLGELYDDHAGFGTNNQASPRLVPSDTDVWAEWDGERAVVTSVRTGSNAERAGVGPGAEIVEIDDVPVADAVRQRMPRTLRADDPAARDWALRAAVAGTHAGPVRLGLADGGRQRVVAFEPGVTRPPERLSTRRIGDTGYVRVHNALGDNGLVADFDSVLAGLRDTRGLVVDLRDTPSGGNTAVARGIMGRLIEAEQPYQRHEIPTEARDLGVRRIWIEHVAPRGPFTYTAPVVVLVGRWTGSMGEGLAIGLDGMGRATVVGTPMAGLAGAVSVYTLPHTGIPFRIPTEALFHIDGTPRHEFVPPTVMEPGGPGEDRALAEALALVARS